MAPTDRAARIAGAWYLSLAVAPFGLLYVPRTLIVPGDAAATAGKILAHETLFRFGIVVDLATNLFLVFLALALRQLLGGVSQLRSAQMVTLAAVSAAVGFVNELNNVAALLLFRGADFLAALDRAQLEALGMFFLGLHRQGLGVDQIFWGLWLLPFGLLVTRSRFLPRILGWLLIVNGVAYIAASLTFLLWPGYASAVSRATMPALLGEVWILLWLLIRGVGERRPATAAAATGV